MPGANFLAQQACQLANALGLKLPSANVPALARRFLRDLQLPEVTPHHRPKHQLCPEMCGCTPAQTGTYAGCSAWCGLKGQGMRSHIPGSPCFTTSTRAGCAAHKRSHALSCVLLQQSWTQMPTRPCADLAAVCTHLSAQVVLQKLMRVPSAQNCGGPKSHRAAVQELADLMQLLSDLYLLPSTRLDLGEAPGRDDADTLFAQAHCKYLVRSICGCVLIWQGKDPNSVGLALP